MASFIGLDGVPAPGQQIVDVRTASEFATGHIAGALNIPLDQIESRVADLDAGADLVLVCKGGTRARMAAGLLAPCRPRVVVLEGGMDRWRQAGNPVVQSVRTRWSLERQVRFIAGLLVVVGVSLGFLVAPGWGLLAGAVGCGLSLAGLTDICPMGMLLGRMPWNQQPRLEANRESGELNCVVRD